MNILVVIDMQNDFIDGALGTKEAVEIVDTVAKEISNKKYDKVFATLDTHDENYSSTLEGQKLPVKHCIKGTNGWELNPSIKKALEKRNATIIEKPTFGSLTLAKEIAELQPDSITLCGLCTDICVVSNALLLRANLPNTEINIIEKACAGVTTDQHHAALETMASCQIDII